jgi:hypothetical protein
MQFIILHEEQKKLSVVDEPVHRVTVTGMVGYRDGSQCELAIPQADPVFTISVCVLSFESLPPLLVNGPSVAFADDTMYTFVTGSGDALSGLLMRARLTKREKQMVRLACRSYVDQLIS